MENLIQAARTQAARLVRQAYETAAARGLLPAGLAASPAAEAAKSGGRGDFTSSFALGAARTLGVRPLDMARVIAAHLELDGSLFQGAEAAGPGFINLVCGPGWYARALAGAAENALGFEPRTSLLPVPPAGLDAVRRLVWEDGADNLSRWAGEPGCSGPTDMGSVKLLRAGSPAPGGDWVQAGEGALRYFLTARPAAVPLELDLDLAAREDGGNPAYRVWYAHARLSAVLDNQVRRGAAPADAGEAAPLLCGEGERALIRVLARWPEELGLAARGRDPSRVNRYAAGLAGEFWRFYALRPFAGEGAGLAARLALADAVRRTLGDGLALLGIPAQLRR